MKGEIWRERRWLIWHRQQWHECVPTQWSDSQAIQHQQRSQFEARRRPRSAAKYIGGSGGCFAFLHHRGKAGLYDLAFQGAGPSGDRNWTERPPGGRFETVSETANDPEDQHATAGESSLIERSRPRYRFTGV